MGRENMLDGTFNKAKWNVMPLIIWASNFVNLKSDFSLFIFQGDPTIFHKGIFHKQTPNIKN